MDCVILQPCVPPTALLIVHSHEDWQSDYSDVYHAPVLLWFDATLCMLLESSSCLMFSVTILTPQRLFNLFTGPYFNLFLYWTCLGSSLDLCLKLICSYLCTWLLFHSTGYQSASSTAALVGGNSTPVCLKWATPRSTNLGECFTTSPVAPPFISCRHAVLH